MWTRQHVLRAPDGDRDRRPSGRVNGNHRGGFRRSTGGIDRRRSAYDFTATTTGGREIALSELRGSVVLLEFWVSWCIPCKASMPHINALWEAYHDQGFVVLAVSTDARAEDTVDDLAKNGFTGLACLWEPGGRSTRISSGYQVDWIPRSILVDRTGIVRYNGHPMDLEAAFVETLLAELAPEPPQ
jgi:thiol-disulfide isomerase/thioredoxin